MGRICTIFAPKPPKKRTHWHRDVKSPTPQSCSVFMAESGSKMPLLRRAKSSSCTLMPLFPFAVYLRTTASISMEAPLGRAATCTVVRAGGFSLKKVA